MSVFPPPPQALNASDLAAAKKRTRSQLTLPESLLSIPLDRSPLKDARNAARRLNSQQGRPITASDDVAAPTLAASRQPLSQHPSPASPTLDDAAVSAGRPGKRSSSPVGENGARLDGERGWYSGRDSKRAKHVPGPFDFPESPSSQEGSPRMQELFLDPTTNTRSATTSAKVLSRGQSLPPLSNYSSEVGPSSNILLRCKTHSEESPNQRRQQGGPHARTSAQNLNRARSVPPETAHAQLSATSPVHGPMPSNGTLFDVSSDVSWRVQKPWSSIPCIDLHAVALSPSKKRQSGSRSPSRERSPIRAKRVFSTPAPIKEDGDSCETTNESPTRCNNSETPNGAVIEIPSALPLHQLPMPEDTRMDVSPRIRPNEGSPSAGALVPSIPMHTLPNNSSGHSDTVVPMIVPVTPTSGAASRLLTPLSPLTPVPETPACRSLAIHGSNANHVTAGQAPTSTGVQGLQGPKKLVQSSLMSFVQPSSTAKVTKAVTMGSKNDGRSAETDPFARSVFPSDAGPGPTNVATSSMPDSKLPRPTGDRPKTEQMKAGGRRHAAVAKSMRPRPASVTRDYKLPASALAHPISRITRSTGSQLDRESLQKQTPSNQGKERADESGATANGDGTHAAGRTTPPATRRMLLPASSPQKRPRASTFDGPTESSRAKATNGSSSSTLLQSRPSSPAKPTAESKSNLLGQDCKRQSLVAARPSLAVSSNGSGQPQSSSSLSNLSTALGKLAMPPPLRPTLSELARPSTSMGFSRDVTGDAYTAESPELSGKKRIKLGQDDTSIGRYSGGKILRRTGLPHSAAVRDHSLLPARPTRNMATSFRPPHTPDRVAGHRNHSSHTGDANRSDPRLNDVRGRSHLGIPSRGLFGVSVVAGVRMRASKKTSLPVVQGSPVKGSTSVTNPVHAGEPIPAPDFSMGETDRCDTSSQAAGAIVNLDSLEDNAKALVTDGDEAANDPKRQTSRRASMASHQLSRSLSGLPQRTITADERMGVPPPHTTRPSVDALASTPDARAVSDGSGRVRSSGMASSDDVEDAARPSPSLDVLKDCVLYVDVRTDEGEDAGSLFVDMLKGLGAKLLTRVGQTCTHIVYKNGLASTITRYRLLHDPKPHVVGIAWVVECVERRARVDEALHEIELEGMNVAGTIKGRRRSMMPKHITNVESAPPSSDEMLNDLAAVTSSSSAAVDVDEAALNDDVDALPPLERARRRRMTSGH